MSRRILWLAAVLLDGAGVAVGVRLWTAADASVAQWGVVVVGMFAVLLVALFVARAASRGAVDRRQKLAATGVCLPLPVLVFVGALDMGTIAGLEWVAIAVAAVVAVINWRALTA